MKALQTVEQWNILRTREIQNAFVKYSFSAEKKKGKQILLSPLNLISFLYKQAVILRNRAYHKGLLRARKLSIPVKYRNPTLAEQEKPHDNLFSRPYKA
jgi:hypothetical protein